MPRRAQVEKPKIFNIVKNYPIFDENGSLKTETNPVWENILKYHNEDLLFMQKKNLHHKIFYNLGNIKVDLLKHFKIEPNATKKQKERLNNDSIGFDVYHEINKLKFCEKYHSVIRIFQSEPFNCTYWYPEQKQLCLDFGKYFDINELTFFMLPKVMKNVVIGNFTSNDVFLIIISTKIENLVCPLYQTVTDEANNDVFISKFIREIVKDGLAPPTSICIMLSFPHVNAACHILNQCSFEKYLERVFEQIIRKNSSTVFTYLHVDLMHVLIAIQHFKFDTDAAKKFFTFAIIYLSKLDDIEKLTEDFKNLWTLFQERFENEKIIQIKHYFVSKFTAEIWEVYNYFVSIMHNPNLSFSIKINEWNISKNHALSQFFDKRINVIYLSEDDSIFDFKKKINGYFSPNASNEISIILKNFPTWVQIFPHDPFTSTLSAISHAQTIETISGFNAPQFLVEHLTKLDGLITQSRVIIEKLKSKKVARNLKFHDCSYLSYEENWMGKNPIRVDDEIECNVTGYEKNNLVKQTCHMNESFSDENSNDESYCPTPTKKFKDTKVEESKVEPEKGLYVSKFPALGLCYAQKLKQKKHIDQQIRSGAGLRQRQLVDGKRYRLSVTSNFDSIAEIFCFICKDIRVFKEYFEKFRCTNKKTCMLQAVFDYTQKGKVQIMYNYRAHIFNFYGQVQDGILNFNDVPGKMAAKVLLEKSNKHYMIKQTKKCIACKEEIVHFITTIEIIFCNFSIKDLVLYVNSFFNQKICSNCLVESNPYDYEINNLLVLDVECNNCITFLNVVPEILEVSNVRYNLIGVIGIKDTDKQSERHYTAFCRSLDGHWYERDNVKKSRGIIKTYFSLKIATLFYIALDVL